MRNSGCVCPESESAMESASEESAQIQLYSCSRSVARTAAVE